MQLLSFLPYPWLQDVIALFLTFGAALSWLRFTDSLATRKIVSRELSRKLIHIGTGPIFVLCWLLFSGEVQSRWLAALVPAAITLQFFLIGMGWVKDDGAVQAMSREGDRRELLYGPTQYGIIFVTMTLIFWLDSPIGIIVLMILCWGDGLADVVGRRYGKNVLPFNHRKTWAGSTAMLVSSFVFSFAYLALFQRLDVWDIDLARSVVPILLICLAATVVEAVSGEDTDNVTITIAALGMAWLITDGIPIWNVPFLG
ncbi:MAG: phosphatidate cytidylyltransferase [Chloroflexota bacterium]|nr:phosphatidate cytidylyltransferase [Chloroflexota bacterium]